MKYILSILFFSLTTTSIFSLPFCSSEPGSYWNNCFGVVGIAEETYIGEIRDGQLHKGTEISHGDTYIGEFKDGEPHGLGTIVFPDGAIYVGEFKDNKMHGEGTYIWVGGRTYVGEWRDNKMYGLGTMTWTVDGSAVTYQMKNGDIAEQLNFLDLN